MCVACVSAAAPEVMLAVGGYAALRLGRPVERLRGRFQASPDAVDEGPREPVVAGAPSQP